MRIAAIADIHYRANSTGTMRQLLGDIEQKADLLVMAGDFTDTGLTSEMEVLVKDLKQIRLPMVAVLGNHDYESDQEEVLKKMMRDAGIMLLDGGAVCEFGGVGFVGTKGYAGGFGSHMIQPFGERNLKTFIQESVDEAVRLENALAKLDCAHKVGVLHYSPIVGTLEGESPELFPFLGCTRLANALDRHGVDVIVHGHAHH
ncbi:MAG: metallophosphoesterase family protein, partial [Rudaea sp.]